MLRGGIAIGEAGLLNSSSISSAVATDRETASAMLASSMADR